jgi:hypothetical protein
MYLKRIRQIDLYGMCVCMCVLYLIICSLDLVGISTLVQSRCLIQVLCNEMKQLMQVVESKIIIF